MKFRVMLVVLCAGILAPPPAVGSLTAVTPLTVADCLSLPDGTYISLPGVMVDRLYENSQYLVVKDPWSANVRLIVFLNDQISVVPGQIVDVFGYLTTLRSGHRAVARAAVDGYTDSFGQVVIVPVPGEMFAGRQELTDSSSTFDGMGFFTMQSGEPPMDPSATPDPAKVHACITINKALTPPPDWEDPDGWRVSLSSRPISNPDSGFFYVDEDGSSDTLKVYYTGSVNTDHRIVQLTGTIREVNNDLVLVVDKRPQQSPESFRGRVLTAPPGTIAYAKTLPDGVQVNLDENLVSRNLSTYMYVQPQTGGGGIRIDLQGGPGDDSGSVLLNLSGTLGTVGGERVINNPTYSFYYAPGPRAMNMNMCSFISGPLGDHTPGADQGVGIHNTGMLVRLTGRVTYVDPDPSGSYFYLDDGFGFDDGTHDPPVSGIRVVPRAGINFTPLDNEFLTISGISGLEKVSGSLIPVLRYAASMNDLKRDRNLEVWLEADACDEELWVNILVTSGGLPVAGENVNLYTNSFSALFSVDGVNWEGGGIILETDSSGIARAQIREWEYNRSPDGFDTLIIEIPGHEVTEYLYFRYSVSDILSFSASPSVVPTGVTYSDVTVTLTSTLGVPYVDSQLDISVVSGDGDIVNVTPNDSRTDHDGQVNFKLESVPEGRFSVIQASGLDSCGNPIIARYQVDFLQAEPDDWPMFMHDVRNQGFSRTDVNVDDPEITFAWSTSLPVAQLDRSYWYSHPDPFPTWAIFPHPYIDSSPVQSADTPVIVGAFYGEYDTSSGYVIGLDPITGQQVWRFPSDPEQFVGGVASTGAIFGEPEEKRVVIGSMDGKLYCIDAYDGSLIWDFQTVGRGYESPKILASPVVYNNRVFIGNESARFYSLDAETGYLIWSYDLPVDSIFPDRTGLTSAAVYEHLGSLYIYFGSDEGRFYCLSGEDYIQERLVWSYSDYDQYSMSIIESSPSVYAGYVFWGTSAREYYDNVYCLDAINGDVLWKRRLDHEVRATPSIIDSMLYIGEDTGDRFHAIDSKTGNIQSTYYAHGQRPYFVGSASILDKKTVITGNDNGNIYVFNTDDISSHVFSYNIGGIVSSSPAVTYLVEEGYRWIYITTRGNEGRLYAFKQYIGEGK